MNGETKRILTVNSGSSSVKFALFGWEGTPDRLLDGEVERIGLPGTTLNVRDPSGPGARSRILADHHASAMDAILDCVSERLGGAAPSAVSHRVVFGGAGHGEPEPVTEALIRDLRGLIPMDPEHLPGALLLIETLGWRFPGLPQVASFDTAFHHGLPRVAQLLPLPRRYEARGLRRWGFHGLSYEFCMDELGRVAGPGTAQGRVVVAHLGNGSSLAAVKGGRSMETSMGFSPASGVPMGTRSGDLDPGLAGYFARAEGFDAERFHAMVNFQSGLLGVSETSSDMRDLLEREARDVRAQEAVALYCHQVKKWIGALAAVLGGLDTLVFTGGIGANSPAVRARACEGLGFLGIALDKERNESNAAVASPEDGRVEVRVIHADEELMLARAAGRVLGYA